MKLEVIDNHSFAPDLLSGLPVLDAGCRGFKFSHHFRLTNEVYAVDACELCEPSVPNLTFIHRALVGIKERETRQIVMTPDPEARFIVNDWEKTGYQQITVFAVTIREIMEEYKVKLWDLVKLNVEGCEYDILKTWPGPIARQVVVSFHEHAHPRGDEEINRILGHMRQWYEVFNHVKEPRYGCHPNYWDTVLILKDLV